MASEVTPSDGNTYAVNVGSATLRDSNGNAISCADIADGDVLAVLGQIRDDGGIDCHEAEQQADGGPGRKSTSSGPGSSS